MQFDDRAFLERLIARLREIHDMKVHEDNRAILEIARALLLDAIADVSLRIEEHRRARERGSDTTRLP